MRHIQHVILISLLVFSAAPLAWAQQGSGYTGSHMWGGGWMFMGPLTMVLFLAALIAAIVVVVRLASGRSSSQSPQERGRPTESPLDILKMRYARGEITQAEFEEMRRVLTE